MIGKILVGCIAVWLFAIGWVANTKYSEYEALECHDYTTKNAVWKGYSAKDSNEHRCFWVEQAYPWRVRQGRVD